VERYFSSSRVIFERSEDTEGNLSTTLVYPKKTSLRRRLQLPKDDLLTDDETRFLDFAAWMLQLDPEKRPLAGQALLHPWFDDVDLNDVSYVDT
jgi:serine/threonine protein kinase